MRKDDECRQDSEQCKHVASEYAKYHLVLHDTNDPNTTIFMIPEVGSTSKKYDLALKSVRAKSNVKQATLDNFKISKLDGKTRELVLIKNLAGPQDVELEIRTNFYDSKGTYYAFRYVLLMISVYEHELN